LKKSEIKVFDWLLDGPWKLDGKLDPNFRDFVANDWLKRFGGDIHSKRADVLSHFKKDPANLPIRWEQYQSEYLNRYESTQILLLNGVEIKPEYQDRLIANQRAITQSLPPEFNPLAQPTAIAPQLPASSTPDLSLSKILELPQSEIAPSTSDLSLSKFSAILMADLENEGLSDYLSVVKASSSTTKDNKAQVVKIPHHGAWPVNGNELEILLELVEAELAILSVGSQNNYGHVRPELFKALITLQNKAIQNKKQLSFICTEVTRTCKSSPADCSAMKNKGLSSTEKCAGEITIIAEDSGKWTLKTETKHSDVVKDFNYAACTERANLI
jgi:hypothetical protein